MNMAKRLGLKMYRINRTITNGREADTEGPPLLPQELGGQQGAPTKGKGEILSA